ncbi:uncharacterized protein SCHCODRAFT_02614658 [Schizophyllum commune H4-8]|uniref:uncharacterized protein n=1 Tax=Schizophyllum commune (strain H4-8 / FGSC 9210) TaxID=578458 RepID=UPI00215FFBCE|nr:uncharacterized protein SCHCODRAFT_02614658 [Schizophyllum commune H4-8]KAI5896375.1 hypothetical protein SCHCODRAFT_02614658 [Schizophyllum commune H4-8]
MRAPSEFFVLCLLLMRATMHAQVSELPEPGPYRLRLYLKDYVLSASGTALALVYAVMTCPAHARSEYHTQIARRAI